MRINTLIMIDMIIHDSMININQNNIEINIEGGYMMKQKIRINIVKDHTMRMRKEKNIIGKKGKIA